MSADRDLIHFACEHCGRRVKARRNDRGRRCKCAGCNAMIVVPDNGAAGYTIVEGDGDLVQPPHSLRGLSSAVLVSFVIHAVILGVLALIFFQKKDFLGITLIASQLPDVQQPDLVLNDVTFEADSDERSAAFGKPLDSSQILPTIDHDMAVASPASPDRTPASRGTERSGETASGDGGTSLSPVTRQRLALANGKSGDYEVALTWSGPSDLDLHVGYVSFTRSTRRAINFLFRGSPQTGFLDIDANSGQTPFTEEPIEHVRWNTKRPPPGVYEIGVHGFALRGNRPGALPPAEVEFIVEVKTPEGVKNYTESVGHFEFASVCTLQIGGSKAAASAEEQAKRLLDEAKENLTEADDRSKSVGRGKLNGIIRRFPKTSAATEARLLLQSLKS